MNGFFQHDIKLKPGTKARAEDVNARFDAIVEGFDKFPAPHPVDKGFADPVAVGTPTAPGHAVTAGQAMGGGLSYAADTGMANAYVVNLAIAPTSYRDGLTITFKATNANTGASTINVNGLGIKQLCRSNGEPLAAGDIAAGQIVTVIYNGTKFLGTAAFAGQFNELIAQNQGYANQAAGSANTATTQAGIATAKATEATNQAGIATTQAGIATAKATEAANSATATAADRVQTGLDKAATAADRMQTGLDRTATAADRLQTGQDKAATAADRTQTGLDKVATAADRVQTGLDRTDAANFAASAALQAETALSEASRATAAAEAAEAAAEGVSGGGLEWIPYSTDQTAIKSKGVAMDTSSGIRTVTPIAAPSISDSFGVGDLKGTFHLNKCKAAFTGLKLHGVIQTEDMDLDIKNQRVVFSWTGDADGWIITELTPTGNSWEYMPYAELHIQNQLATGSYAPAIAAGIQQVPLNQVIKNDIAGASLAANNITLPPGNYRVDAEYSRTCTDANDNVRAVVQDAAGNNLAIGVGVRGYSNWVLTPPRAKGFFTLTTTTIVKLMRYASSADVAGLHRINQAPYEVFADIRITKIGGNYAPKPIARASRLQLVPGLNTTGDIEGFDVRKSAANQLTIGKGTCMDSNRLIPLALTADTPVVIPSNLANQLYQIAVVRLVSNGNITVRAYLSEIAMASDPEIDAFRWIMEWGTNGSSSCKAGFSNGPYRIFTKATETLIFGSVSTTYIQVNHTPQMTPSRVEMIKYAARHSSVQDYIYASLDAVDVAYMVGLTAATTVDTDAGAWGSAGYDMMSLMPFNENMFFRSSNNTLNLHVHMLKFRR